MTQLVFAYLLNATWITPLLALSAFGLERCSRSAPTWRSQIWTAALVCAALLPVLPACGLQLDAAAGLKLRGVAAESGGGGRLGWSAMLPLGRPTGNVLVVFAAVVVSGALLRLGVTLLAVRRLVRSSEPLDLAPEAARALAAFTVGHGRAAVEVRRTRAVSSPAVVGWRRPVVLAPPEIDRLDAGQLRSTLLHEAAHVIRGDYLANLLVEVVSTVLAWHPVVYRMKARLRTAREAACDALAAAASPSRHAYASGLVGAARVFAERKTARNRAAATAFELLGRGDLEARIADLLSARAEGGRASRRRTSFAAGLAAIAVLGPVLLFRVAPAAPVVTLALRPPLIRSAAATSVETAKLGAFAGVARPKVHRRGAAARRVLLAQTERRRLAGSADVVLTGRSSLAASTDATLLRARIDDAAGSAPALRSAILWIFRAEALPQPGADEAGDAEEKVPTGASARPRSQSWSSPTPCAEGVQIADPVEPIARAQRSPSPQPLPSIT